MASATNNLDLAMMSEASYVHFDIAGISDPIKVKDALLKVNEDTYEGSFSQKMADRFLSKWRVADHQKNTPENDFSSTLFEQLDEHGNGTGEFVYALRGTEPGLLSKDIFETDIGDIALEGLAIKQIVDMYNDWQRMNAADGHAYHVATLVPDAEMSGIAAGILGALAGNPVTQKLLAIRNTILLRDRSHIVIDGGTAYKIDLSLLSTDLFSVGDDRRFGSGSLAGGNLMAVTGHSLGGHLATAFTRLFPNSSANAVSFNGAGYGEKNTLGLREFGETNVANLFSLLNGADDFDGSRILNFYGDKMPEIITADEDALLVQPGHHAPLFIESGDPTTVFGHGGPQMTDASAVYQLFIEIVPALQTDTPESTFPSLLKMFQSAARADRHSYEALSHSLADLFQVATPSSTTDERDSLYQLVEAIRNDPDYKAKSEDTTNTAFLMNVQDHDSVSILANNAANSLAYRYAIKHLAPFVLMNSADIYERHNANHELDLAETQPDGQLTEKYLKDRATLLLAATKVASANGRDYKGAIAGAENELYYDFSLNDGGYIVSSTESNWVSDSYVEFSRTLGAMALT